LNAVIRFSSLVIGLAALAGIIYAVVVALGQAAKLFATLDKTVEAALVAASATIIASAVTITVGKIYELRQHVQKENREKKVPVYEDLLKFFFRMLNATKDGQPLEDPEIVEFMKTFNERFIVWGSDSVVAAWAKWRQHLSKPVPDEVASTKWVAAMYLMAEVMLTIRRDLGHSNKRLDARDILSLFINDVDEVPENPEA
jgi:hypothetical protein